MASYFTAISVANEATSSVAMTTLIYLPSSPSELLNNYVTLFSTDTDDVTRTKTSYMSSLHKNNDSGNDKYMYVFDAISSAVNNVIPSAIITKNTTSSELHSIVHKRIFSIIKTTALYESHSDVIV